MMRDRRAGRRRLLLQAGLAGTAGAAYLLPALRCEASGPPDALAPQPGDYLAVAGGPSGGRPLMLADLPPGGPPLHVWPLAPQSRLLRNGSPRNAIVLVRSDDTAAAPVAYSALCTHEGCAVDVWLPAERRLYCPCHSSEFDPFDEGAVRGGPAPRKLPRLPLRIGEAGRLEVAAGFIGRVYRQRRRRR